MIASAILDRLLHHSHVFLIAGPSYRMRGRLENPMSLAEKPELGQDTA
jgi:DNA replication protein DnaC